MSIKTKGSKVETKYRRDSIVRNSITRIPDFQNYVFIDSYTHAVAVGSIFTSPNHPK